MDGIMLAFDIFASTALAIVFGWAVMSPRVRDGIVIKFGLILMSLGLALLSYSLPDPAPVLRPMLFAGTLTLAGMLVVVVGAVLRVVKPPRRLRRVTDWADLSDSGLVR